MGLFYRQGNRGKKGYVTIQGHIASKCRAGAWTQVCLLCIVLTWVLNWDIMFLESRDYILYFFVSSTRSRTETEYWVKLFFINREADDLMLLESWKKYWVRYWKKHGSSWLLFLWCLIIIAGWWYIRLRPPCIWEDIWINRALSGHKSKSMEVAKGEGNLHSLCVRVVGFHHSLSYQSHCNILHGQDFLPPFNSPALYSNE